MCFVQCYPGPQGRIYYTNICVLPQPFGSYLQSLITPRLLLKSPPPLSVQIYHSVGWNPNNRSPCTNWSERSACASLRRCSRTQCPLFWSERSVVLFSSERGMAWVSRGTSQGKPMPSRAQMRRVAFFFI